MEKKKNYFKSSNSATRRDKALLRKEARIQKTIKNLNSPKKLKKDFNKTPDISAEYDLKKLVKENTLHFHIFQKQVFANKNKNLKVKKLKIVPTSIFKTKNQTQRIVASVLATAALFAGTYGANFFRKHIVPLIEQGYYDYKTNKLPAHKEIGSYDYSESKPQNIIENKDFQKQEEKTTEEKVEYPIIEFNTNEVNSFANLVEKVNETIELYTGNETEFSPIFGYIAENDLREKTINIVCKNEEDKSILIQYDVYDDVLFYSLFDTDLISASDAINNLNLLLDDGNLSDMPQICESFSYDNSIFSHTTPVSKFVEKEIVYENDDEVGEYKETECFKFDIIKLEKNGKIVKQSVKITCEDAEKLSITDENKNLLHNEFIKEPKNFDVVETVLDDKFNIETSLFLNAIRNQKETSQTKSQTNFENEF